MILHVLLSVLIPNSFSHLLVVIVSLTTVIWQLILTLFTRRLYLHGLAFILFVSNHFNKDWVAVSKSCKTFEVCISVRRWCNKGVLGKKKNKSIENMLKPRIEPCGAPDRIFFHGLKVLFKQIICLCFLIFR